MSFRARLTVTASSLMLAVVSLVGPLAPPAAAGYTTLCWGYASCAAKGMPSAGYATAGGTMYWRMYAGHNCTNYAAYRMIKNGLPNVRPWSGGGNAEYWGIFMSSITDATPTVGSVAWWRENAYPAGSSGHVAYVERVVSPTEIIVSQDSWGGDFSWARITKSDRGWPSGFIHFNDLKIRNTAAPTVSGLPKVGGVLTAAPGSWTPTDTTLRYQWLAAGVPISGATSPTLTLGTAQLGKVIRVRVTASRMGYADVVATSAATAAVLPGQISNEVPPDIEGEPVVDEILTADPGAWTPEPARFVYRWRADGVLIDGATSATLPVGPDLVDKALAVTVTARRPGFDPVRRTTRTEGPVAPGTLTAAAAPALSGAALLGGTLSLAPGAVSPEGTAAVTWRRGWQSVPDTDASSYLLGVDDLGRSMRAWVTYTRPGYTPLTLVAGPTAPVRSTTSLDLEATPLIRKGRVRVVVRAEAEGVTAVDGVVRLVSGGRLLAEVRLVDGVASKTLTDLPSGRRYLRVRHPRTRTTTAATTATVVPVA